METSFLKNEETRRNRGTRGKKEEKEGGEKEGADTQVLREHKKVSTKP